MSTQSRLFDEKLIVLPMNGHVAANSSNTCNPDDRELFSMTMSAHVSIVIESQPAQHGPGIPLLSVHRITNVGIVLTQASLYSVGTSTNSSPRRPCP